MEVEVAPAAAGGLGFGSCSWAGKWNWLNRRFSSRLHIIHISSLTGRLGSSGNLANKKWKKLAAARAPGKLLLFGNYLRRGSWEEDAYLQQTEKA